MPIPKNVQKHLDAIEKSLISAQKFAEELKSNTIPDILKKTKELAKKYQGIQESLDILSAKDNEGYSYELDASRKKLDSLYDDYKKLFVEMRNFHDSLVFLKKESTQKISDTLDPAVTNGYDFMKSTRAEVNAVKKTIDRKLSTWSIYAESPDDY